MKPIQNLLPAFLILGLSLRLADTPACGQNTITVPLGGQFYADHLYFNNSDNTMNTIDQVLAPSLAPLNDLLSQPPGTMNEFTFTPFDNTTTTLGPSVYYENDFTCNNVGPCSGNANGPSTGWATDANGTTAATYPLPHLNPGGGGFIFNPSAVSQVTFSGTAPGGYLSDSSSATGPLYPGGPWNLVSCLSVMTGSYENVFGHSPLSGHNTYIASWNGAAFNLGKCDTSGSWFSYSAGSWSPSTEPTWPEWVSVFVKIRSGPPFVPLAAAAAPGCSVANTVLITFSTDLDPTTATDSSRYTVTRQGGGSVTVQSAAVYGASIVPTVKLVLLTLASSLVAGANYTLAVNGVTGLEGEPVPPNSTVNFQATTTPNLVMTEPDPGSGNLRVTFDRPMDRTSSGNPANYHIVSSKGAVSAVTAATPLGPASLPSFLGDEVRLSASGLSSNTLYSLTVSNINSACGSGVSNGSTVSFTVAVTNPKLSAAAIGTNLFLSWSGTNFSLLQSPSLNPPVSWQPSGATLAITGDTVSTHLPIGPGTMFFRLLLE